MSMRQFGIGLLAAAGALGVLSLVLPAHAPAGGVEKDTGGRRAATQATTQTATLTPVSAVLPAPAARRAAAAPEPFAATGTASPVPAEPVPRARAPLPAVLPGAGAALDAPRARSLPSTATGTRMAVTPPPGAAASAAPAIAIVLQDQVSLRAAPRASAQLQAQLWAGEALEVRGEKLDYVQVWDHKRERGGFVHASFLYRGKVGPDDAQSLLTLLRFLRDSPGSESLGIGLAAAYLEAADAQTLNGPPGAEALDALGGFADRLARRASSTKAQDRQAAAILSAHLDVAARYGLNFATYEQDSRMRLCYDGEAFRRVLALPANPEQRARAALGLTRHECVNPDLTPTARLRVDEWRAQVLDRVDAAALPGYLRNRVLMRRAGVWSALAYERAHFAIPTAELLTPALPGAPDTQKAEGAAARALSELAGVSKAELAYEDTAAYAEAAMRVSASRWAALPEAAPQHTRGPLLRTVAGQPGETCVLLLDAGKPDEKNPLARRCTYGLVWTASASLSREGNAMTLAVQTLAAWRELWLFRKGAGGWSIDVLPPASSNPDVGYAEFAGWVPGGTQMLVAREARDPAEGKLKRAFEVIRLDTLATDREVAEPGMLSTFQRWQDASWKRMTLSLR
jgi:hypothetical protein